MPNSLSRAQRTARHEARKAWLQAHSELLAQCPSAAQEVTVAGRAALAAVHAQLVAAGLHAKSSNHKSVRWGIRRLVSELRGHGVHWRQRFQS